MGQITLVRHGQASVQGASYDALSSLGHAQARRLGEHWAERGLRFDAVYVGPRQRHAETAAHIATVYAERGLPWPTPQQAPDLDEHHGLAVLKRAAGLNEPGDGLLSGDVSRDAAIRQLFGRYHEVMGEWAAGAYAADGIEPWRAFRDRAQRALEHLCVGSGRTVAFTSGGLIAAVLGAVLGLDDQRVIDLSATLYNTSLTDVRYRPGDIGVVAFNGTPHLHEASTITRV
jgi:broad specificity phosphatase PhoE